MLKKIATVSILSGLLFVSCTRYANEQELKDLDETTKAAKKAGVELNNLKTERSTLETTLADNDAKLNAAKEEKAQVEGRVPAYDQARQAEAEAEAKALEEQTKKNKKKK